MTDPIQQLPPEYSDQMMAVWQQVADALISGNIQELQTAVQDFITLSPTDQRLLEDLSALLPYPGLPALLISEIFANPEATIGIIKRLGPQASGKELIDNLGTAEQAIVLDALITWMKSEHKIALDNKSQDAKKPSTVGAVSNPINAALENYIATGGILPDMLSLGSLQFLKSNPITLAGLQTADPVLLNKAYQVASGQLLLTLVTQLDRPQSASESPSSDKNQGAIAQKKLFEDIRKALVDNAIPLNMQTFLVLWTVYSMPTVSSLATSSSLALSNTNLATQSATQVANQTADQVVPNVSAVPPSNVTSVVSAVGATVSLNIAPTTVTTPVTSPLNASSLIAEASSIPVGGSVITAATAPTVPGAIAATTTNIVAANTAETQGSIAASIIVSDSPIVISVLTSLPALFASENIQASAVLTDELKNELGLLSYVYSQMAPYWCGPAAVSLMTVGGNELTEEGKLAASVRAFTIAIGALLNDPTFDKLLAAIIKNSAPNISAEQLKVFIAAMKISILANALIALHILILRKTQGQFNPKELAELILSPPVDDQSDIDDLEKGVIDSIRAELINIPEDKQEAFINSLLSCYSGDMDVSALVDPTQQFLNLCDPSFIFGQTSTSKG